MQRNWHLKAVLVLRPSESCYYFPQMNDSLLLALILNLGIATNLALEIE